MIKCVAHCVYVPTRVYNYLVLILISPLGTWTKQTWVYLQLNQCKLETQVLSGPYFLEISSQYPETEKESVNT